MKTRAIPGARRVAHTARSAQVSWSEFWQAPLRLRVFLVAVAGAAVILPLTVAGPTGTAKPVWLTVSGLVVVSVLNVEIGRAMTGGLSHTHQPHKALSTWAFASALLLPPMWLLIVVPLTYAHARWRGLRVALWKWVGSACFLVLAGLTALGTRHSIYGDQVNWMNKDGGLGLLAMLAAAAVFLAVESALFAGSAWLNRAEDEKWLRQTLRNRSFYLTEAGVLLIGGLLAAVWTAGAWFAVAFFPIYALAQRAALHEPLRERAEAAAQLATKISELEDANQFKLDMMGILGHEIGNPLTSIQGYAEVGADALAEGDQRRASDAFAVVARNALQVRAVLREALAVVGSERGHLTARREECLVAPHLLAAVEAQMPGSPPIVECPPDLIAVVQPGHLDQILGNLLSNAAKYAGGARRLTAQVTADDKVEILVDDEGPGVPFAFRDHLFERFSRDVGTAQHVTGTGLGLFITRELARANGGDVTHRDRDPSGSVFVVTLSRVS